MATYSRDAFRTLWADANLPAESNYRWQDFLTSIVFWSEADIQDLTDGGATTLHKHDHGGQDGLTDDDHTQYLLASQATNRTTFDTYWGDLTDGGITTLHDHDPIPGADHDQLNGLLDDDHTIYALLAGRAAGQTIYGTNNTDSTTSPLKLAASYIGSSPYIYIANSTTAGIGVNITAPTHTLHVGGSGTGCFVTGLGVGTTYNSSYTLNVSGAAYIEDSTGGLSGKATAVYVTHNFSSSYNGTDSAPTSNAFYVYTLHTNNLSSVDNIDSVNGLLSQASHRLGESYLVTGASCVGMVGDAGGGYNSTATYVIGLWGQSMVYNDASATYAIGVFSTGSNNSRATASNSIGFYAATRYGTNTYGIYVNDMSGSTLKYGVWQNSTADLNYFAGKTGFNKSNPSYAVEANGTVAGTVLLSSVTSGAPITVNSTVSVASLNADYLDGQHGAYYRDASNFSGTNWTDLTDGGTTTLHIHERVYHTMHTADGSWSGTYVAGTYGENLTYGDLIYLKSDGKWYQTDADAEATAGNVLLGMALNTTTANNAGNVLLHGTICETDWNWSVGACLYVSTTAGDAQTAVPSGASDVVRVIGYAYHADSIYFAPTQAWAVHS